ncbi:MAG: pyridoxamine 5'-phosphate oxidase family protein [Roseibium album]|jgi:nitroimidazol reductase NimA-like FMN-containing flavoprotein (pyridoxamine 5'-phosphate oxidase superfamily)|uniref:pyridoxamine 5'-phosphate oxidase family protein n=1 Tax=Roseibium album TaxID=311410 RepID=UPI000CF14A3A|nr:nitroimidazol reductase NimA-like FMN-containing flavoprotein (pyridoxamine 5'-phosphate oxidase superfamily) [Labrenzia sp. EL_142]MBG6163613.1 nitroimidazol reductase NimA-like FMN-containing flavoprotein (pyridoxamine 5'-phosphate oxidase superfamily) [Labrenzia sp. EL_195]MBG6173214.1 nitroimidazol reductase NimA-like FMN-containing flavoprotein (pyridoxamine 5'-phosphate oxidase superfamily) [Labrenzia sp. EL_132]MBG6203087.1 nitroimidazol reductase NimA-like FMN-containing flavoprotein 
MSTLEKRKATNLPRYAKIRQMNRGSYDRALANEILDAGLVAHCGFIHENKPMVIPMAYARIGDKLYIHGASTTRIIKDNAKGVPASLTVTLIDGLVVARSAFHHSMNYRCAIVHGTAHLVEDHDKQIEALAAITDHILPGRWDECRAMMAKEHKATGVLVMDMEHVSTKVRTGGPVDDTEDLGTDLWAGVVPVTTALGQPFDAYDVPEGTPVPESIPAARRKFA